MNTLIPSSPRPCWQELYYDAPAPLPEPRSVADEPSEPISSALVAQPSRTMRHISEIHGVHISDVNRRVSVSAHARHAPLPLHLPLLLCCTALLCARPSPLLHVHVPRRSVSPPPTAAR